jgi:intein-encoded DNA endonuclease-like protein
MDAYLRDKFGRFMKGSPQPYGFKKGNIPWNKGRFKAKISFDEINRLYNVEHKTIKEIAEMFGYTYEGMRKWMIRRGLILRSSAESRMIRGSGNVKKVNLQPSEQLFYVLGVIYGDGNYRKNGDTYRVELRVTSKAFAKSFEENLRQIGLKPCTWVEKRSERNPSWSDLYTVSACSARLCKWLKEKSYDDIWNIMQTNTEYVKAFLRGFYESEGCLHLRKEGGIRVSVSNTKKELIDLVARAVEHLGFKYSITTYKDERYTNGVCYRLEILGRRPEKERFIKLINPCIKNLRATTPD